MIVVEGKMLGRIRSKVVLSEPKIYDLIKIILNSAFDEGVYNRRGQQLRISEDSVMDGGPISPSPMSMRDTLGYGIRALPKAMCSLRIILHPGLQPASNNLLGMTHEVALSFYPWPSGFLIYTQGMC